MVLLFLYFSVNEETDEQIWKTLQELFGREENETTEAGGGNINRRKKHGIVNYKITGDYVGNNEILYFKDFVYCMY